jgi:pre-60S factor REI1
MKSDWHRYNLKRRVAGLPAIDEPMFNEKVQKLSQAEDDDKKAIVDKEKKNTKKEQRRKEKEVLLEKKRQLLEIAKQNMLKSMQESSESKEEETTKKIEQLEIKEEPAEEAPETELTEEQQAEQQAEQLLQEKLQNSVEIPKEVCLFCNKKFPYFEACCTHMFKYHGFFIPEQNYLTDKEGLVKYMSEKIGVGNVCIVCNYQGKSIEAVRAHMLAKKHCSILYESENEKLEISEFYDFSSTYQDLDGKQEDGDWEDIDDEEGFVVGSDDDEEEEEELPQQVSYDDGVELHLPTGVKVGHRSLARYFRQNLRPETILSEGQGTVIAAESRHLATVYDRQELLEKKRIWRNERSNKDRDDRRAQKFINNQPHYRDQLLQ